MITIGLVNIKSPLIEKSLVDNLLTISNEIIVFGEKPSDGLCENIKWGGYYKSDYFHAIIQTMCELSSNEYFMMCTDTSRIGIGINALEKITNEFNRTSRKVWLLNCVCVDPGRDNLKKLCSLDFSIYGKIYSKEIVKVAIANKDSTEAEFITNLLSSDYVVARLDNVFYYETSKAIYSRIIKVDNSELFLAAAAHLPIERRVLSIKMWLKSIESSRDKEKLINQTVAYFGREGETSKEFLMKNRIKKKIQNNSLYKKGMPFFKTNRKHKNI